MRACVAPQKAASFRLRLGNGRPHDELAALHDLEHGLVNAASQTLLLGGKIDEGDGFCVLCCHFSFREVDD